MACCINEKAININVYFATHGINTIFSNFIQCRERVNLFMYVLFATQRRLAMLTEIGKTAILIAYGITLAWFYALFTL
jgi:hypothetical protein